LDWKAVYLEAKDELDRLKQDRKKLEESLAILDARIEALSTTLRALAPIIGEEPLEGPLLKAAKESSREPESKSTPAVRQKSRAAEGDPEHPSMRDLCRQIVHESEQPLTIQEITTALTGKGVDVSQYANIGAVIHAHLDKMPDRVRSFKKRAQHQGKWQTFRFYEAIR
jgi:hypothetical protein